MCLISGNRLVGCISSGDCRPVTDRISCAKEYFIVNIHTTSPVHYSLFAFRRLMFRVLHETTVCRRRAVSAAENLRPEQQTFALMGGALESPLRCFQIAIKRRRFLSYIFFAYVVKFSNSGHARSGHHVTLSDLT